MQITVCVVVANVVDVDANDAKSRTTKCRKLIVITRDTP